jgi:hypothetical protein
MCVALSLSFGGEVFNFSNASFPLLQAEGAILHPDAAKVVQPVACFDMGLTGTVEIPNIAIPQGPFSIESRFYVRGYNETDPNISEVLAAFDCGSGTEGTDFRIGGGYNYALKIQDVYKNFSDWDRPDGAEKASRAAVSKAIGEFCLGSGQGAWKEVFTDRCIEKNKWMHMVATWNGEAMLLYLNGHNATDAWRTVGSALPKYIKTSRTLMIGNEFVDGGRHINGMIEYVKIYNEAFSPSQVWNSFRQSIGNDQCAGFIEIESPRCGEVISHGTKIKFAMNDSADNDITPPGKTFSIQICREPTFTDAVRTFTISATESTFGELVGWSDADFDGLLYVRVLSGSQSGLSKKTASDPAAQSGTLAAYFVSSATNITQRTNHGAMVNGLRIFRQLTHRAIFDIRGRTLGIGAKATLSSMKNGVYFVKTENGASRKFLYAK